MKKVLSLIRALLFPKRCIYCGEVIGFAPRCRCEMQRRRCRLEGEAALLRGVIPRLAGGVACYRYVDPVRRGIHRLKFGGASQFAACYGEEMAAKLREELPDLRPDAVIPIPSTRKERAERGYDIPHLMAQQIARHLAIPIWDDILIKESETQRQHDLSLKERKSNLTGAFGLCNAERLQGRIVLLCDDVATSGATLEEAAKVLRAGGAAEVWGVVFARAMPR